MKVLLATGLYPPEIGGPATYTRLLEERLPALGIDVVVLPFRTVRHLPPGIRHVAYFLKCFFRARKANVVYAQDTVSVGLPAALAAKLAGAKFLVRVPGDYAWEQARQRFGVSDELDDFQTNAYGWRVELLRRVQTFVVRRARAVVVPSEYMCRIVSDWLPRFSSSMSEAKAAWQVSDGHAARRPQPSIVTIYSSIEAPEVVVPKERPSGFLIVSSGRRVPWKNFDALERVVARESAWRFKLVENLPRAQALGWVRAADAFALNSTYEGLSHALVEAMLLGTPVVATAVGGNPELIRDGIDGILVAPKDDEALYAALKKVAEDPAAARARAHSAQERARGLFSISMTIEKLAALLQTVCESY